MMSAGTSPDQMIQSAGVPGPLNGLSQIELDSQGRLNAVEEDGHQEGESAPSERQASPKKLYRAALLRSRFADTILKAREKALEKVG
ncbi:transcription factor GTE11-like isoform X1 [Carica papaya]|uniref:transcription factor GTE11-like isoform X1 n=1 Tax=Carica papaya TaxID=3649 RepID=UPI000B8CF752|nr:transcription factor GTE11-like isoform X1 [Carica papaya]